MLVTYSCDKSMTTKNLAYRYPKKIFGVTLPCIRNSFSSSYRARKNRSLSTKNRNQDFDIRKFVFTVLHKCALRAMKIWGYLVTIRGMHNVFDNEQTSQYHEQQNLFSFSYIRNDSSWEK